jgi:hypothetical protein
MIHTASLREFTRNVFIVAHREDTSLLESTMRDNGFDTHVQRGPYTVDQTGWSAQMKCLANHANVWRAISTEPKDWTIVVEADFVPVVSFGARVAPLPLVDEGSVGFAWLYSAGSTLYGFCKFGFPHGHGNTTVAYLLNGSAAKLLLDFFEREVAKNVKGDYVAWETYLGIFLRREKGVLNYIATCQFGEHGGRPQPEHAGQGVRSWHQADVLSDRLAFLPSYAQGSRVRYVGFRVRAILRGWVRLLTGRFFDPRYINSDTSQGRVRMMSYSVLRLLRLTRY